MTPIDAPELENLASLTKLGSLFSLYDCMRTIRRLYRRGIRPLENRGRCR